MTLSEKIDKLLVDVAEIKLVSSTHTSELQDLKEKLDPVFFHVNGMKWVIKIASGVIGLIACVAGILMLFK